jgi:flagellar protein FliO/FliZ
MSARGDSGVRRMRSRGPLHMLAAPCMRSPHGAKYPTAAAGVIRVTAGESAQIKSAEPLSHIRCSLACALLLIARIFILQFVRSRLLLNATARGRTARCARWSLGSLAAIGGASRVLHAATATPFAAPVQQAAPTAAGGLLRVVVALLIVLAAVLAAAWLARRMRALSAGAASSSLELLAQLPLGARERAVLVRVGECQLLLGVAPGAVRTLHVFTQAAASMSNAVVAPQPGTPQPGTPAVDTRGERPSFKSLLLKSLGK